MRTRRLKAASSLVGLIGVFANCEVHAQSPNDAETEIRLLKQQLRRMEEKLDRLQKQSTADRSGGPKNSAQVVVAPDPANAQAAVPRKGPGGAPSDTIVKMTNNRPTICTADEQNCVSITSRVHFDAGGYDYRPNTPSTVPQRLDDGVNARRARIGILGKFFGDWNYGLIYDFAGSSDGFASTAGVGGAPVGFLPGGALSGIENAYLSYTGFRPFGGTLAIEGGYMDIPYTMDEATSSNDTVFIERASSGVIAANIAASDFRSTLGARWYNNSFWIGAYATGPTAGAIHSASSINPNGTTEQFGSVVRAAGQIASGENYSLHLGADAEFLIRPPHNLVTGAQTLTLSDRPELRIDPTAIVTTGAIAGVSAAQVYSVEAAATYGPLFLQGEYFWFNVERRALPVPLANARFEGGYAQASYVLTGESRPYNAASAAYGGINPANPFSLARGGWGAWEIGGRVSTVDLNDQLAAASGIAGGRQTIYTAALNWYVNRNVRFMLNYLHGDIRKQASSINATDTGAKLDAFALRTQVAF